MTQIFSSDVPLVSIVTPCYNAARFVAETIASVRAQTLTRWEQIIVDDGSSDGSYKTALDESGTDSRIRVVRTPNHGPSAARNTGFRYASASSEYVMFLDADDVLDPRALSTCINYFGAHPDVGMLHYRCTCVDEHGHAMESCATEWNPMRSPRYAPTKFWVRELPESYAETPFASIYALAGVLPSLVMMRRRVYEQSGGWDETFGQMYEDTDLWLRVALSTKVHFLPEALVRYRRHSNQSTADSQKAKYARQLRKLYDGWARSQLPESQREILGEARRFCNGRLAVYKDLRATRTSLRSFALRAAARNVYSALRRCCNAARGDW